MEQVNDQDSRTGGDEGRQGDEGRFTIQEINALIQDLVIDLLGYKQDPKQMVYPDWIKELALRLVEKGWRKNVPIHDEQLPKS